MTQVSRFILVALLAVPTITLAQQIPAMQPAMDTELKTMPQRGVTKSVVQAEFGQPAEQIDAVGSPPISRWIYSDFTVYFEDERVVTAVDNKKKRQ